MERSIGLDPRTECARQGQAGAASRDKERLHVCDVDVGGFNARMHHGVGVKRRLRATTPRPGSASHRSLGTPGEAMRPAFH